MSACVSLSISCKTTQNWPNVFFFPLLVHMSKKAAFIRSENKGFERSNSGFSRNNKVGSREDISERITFKAPKTPSPVRGGDNNNQP